MDALKCRELQTRIQGANQQGQSRGTAGDELAEVSDTSAEAKNVTNQVSWGMRGACVCSLAQVMGTGPGFTGDSEPSPRGPYRRAMWRTSARGKGAVDREGRGQPIHGLHKCQALILGPINVTFCGKGVFVDLNRLGVFRRGRLVGSMPAEESLQDRRGRAEWGREAT